MGKIRDYFADRRFFKNVFAIALPMVIQNGITNIVGVLDNVMVGNVSSEATSGVAIVNQFMFVFYLVTFGAVSAAGIFTAQYHGKGDVLNVRATFRAKFIICTLSGVAGLLLFIFFGGAFIGTFLTETASDIDLELTRSLAQQYLTVMLWGIIPYSLSQSYASTLRETGRTIPPMAASSAAVIVNLVLNYILIFGHFGAPELGVRGAAIATVASRFIEFLILVIWTGANRRKCPFIKGAFRSPRVPLSLVKNIVVMGLPLMLNEGFWALSITVRSQCYSTCGLDAVTAMSISTTVTNLFNVIYLSLGSAIAVIIGNLLGAGKIEEAKRTDKKLLIFTVGCTVVVSLMLAAASRVFPMFYKTSDTVASLASYMIIVFSVVMPFDAYANGAYFTLRSGGKVLITVLFDSVFMWVVIVPAMLILSRAASIDIHLLFAIGQGLEIFKAVLGAVLLRKTKWAVRIVRE